MSKITQSDLVTPEERIPVRPADNQTNRYNMTMPQSFSVYNDEGSVVYRGEVEQMANLLRAELFGQEPQPVVAEEKKEETVVLGKNTKKRALFMVIALLLSVVVIAVAIGGLFGIPYVSYASVYDNNGEGIAMLDPVFSFLSDKFGLTISGMPTEFGKAFSMQGESIPEKIAEWALPIAIVLYIVLAVVIAVISIINLASKKNDDGAYKKVGVGAISIMMLLCALIVAVGGLFASGTPVDELLGFVTGENIFSIGYGLWGMLAVPVVTFVSSCLFFGKKKIKTEKQA